MTIGDDEDWRSDPATDKQRTFASELGLRIPAYATKGTASDLIDGALESSRRARRVEIEPHVIRVDLRDLILEIHGTDLLSLPPTNSPPPFGPAFGPHPRPTGPVAEPSRPPRREVLIPEAWHSTNRDPPASAPPPTTFRQWPRLAWRSYCVTFQTAPFTVIVVTALMGALVAAVALAAVALAAVALIFFPA